MFIACSHKVHTPNPEEFGNVLDCMPEWMMWIGDSTISLIYQSNFVDTADIHALKTRMTCLTSAFFDRNHSIIDVDDFHVKGKDISINRNNLKVCTTSTRYLMPRPERLRKANTSFFVLIRRVLTSVVALLVHLLHMLTRHNESARNSTNLTTTILPKMLQKC